MLAFEFVAVLAAAVFAGAAIYISLVEHPARMECGTKLAATEFGPSYRRAAVMQSVLAIVSAAAGIGAWLQSASLSWLAGAALIFAVVPFTLIAIMPTNQKLLSPELDLASNAARRLLERWGTLHAFRSALSFVATVIFLASMIWR
jgi:Domain of unknown function (DUF1772)